MSNRDTAMKLDGLILRTAFRHRVKEPDLAAGQARFEAIVGETFDAAEFAQAVGRLLTAGLIHDPVRLPAGALQCHWCLEVTPEGFAAVKAMG
jgi:hypothetical protein